MIVGSVTLPPASARTRIIAEPLSREAFAPYGDVISNPRPGDSSIHPNEGNSRATGAGELPYGAKVADGGAAIHYTQIASMINLHSAGTPRMTLAVLIPKYQIPQKKVGGSTLEVPLPILERHPFTTQSFIPLSADASKRYLVVVAPSLESWNVEDSLEVTYPDRAQQKQQEETGSSLPNDGGPDVMQIRAFVATMEQAVTYSPGTWHSPMLTLGPAESAVEFVVVQFANNVPIEDLQQVVLQDDGADGAGGLSVLVEALD